VTGEALRRTSLRHFWLRIAYSSRVVAVSLAIVWVLRRLASLSDIEGLWSSPLEGERR
jgi:hypothetical protein